MKHGLVMKLAAMMIAAALGCSSSTPAGESPPSAKSTAAPQQTASPATTATAQSTSAPTTATAAATAAATVTETATLSATAGLCKLGKSWDGCADQQVELIGEKAKMVMEHPMATMPGSKQVQDYIDADGRQVVVLTDKAITCKGKLTATGTLRSVKLGGAPGTRGSYEGYRLDNAVIVCK